MKIIQLTAENVKRLEAVQVTPTGALVVVAGDNGQGKSSVLDSIIMSLAGPKAFPKKPVRKGEDKATIELDLGDYIVTRTITATGGGGLVVRNKDNVKMSSPQELLDKLVGPLSFDPLAFRGMKPPERAETLATLLKLDFTGKDAEIDKAYSERTAVNREVKALETRVGAMTAWPGVPEVEEVSAAIIEQQTEAIMANTANQKVRDEVGKLKNATDAKARALVILGTSIDDVTLEIERLQKKLQGLEADKSQQEDALKAAVDAHKAAMAKAADLRDADIAPFAQRLKEVEEVNRKVRSNKNRKDLVDQLKAKSKEADILTSAIEKAEKFKRDALANTKFPVEGLSLSDTKEVIFNGIPFDDISTGEQIRVSVAMGLAMNSELKILIVHQGNDLDAGNLALVAQMAEAAGAQVWIERVSTEGAVTVIIEDGHARVPEAKEESAITKPTEELNLK